MIEERYLYHCFPRRGANTGTEVAKGLQILECIRDFGLLLLPEALEWNQPVEHGPERTFPVVQPRVCFTDLSPGELPEHAARFGHFAIEFEMESARRLGAIPVFYVPQRNGGVGTSLLAILLDSRAVIRRAAGLHGILNGEMPVNERIDFTTGFARNPAEKKSFDINSHEARLLLEALDHQATPWRMLSVGMDALLNFFYPADDVIHDKPLQYYRQREWRIACGFAIKGVEILRRPSDDEVRRISAIDEQFFLRPIQTDHGPIQPFDRSLVHPGIDGKTIMQMARRVIVPEAALEETKNVLSKIKDAPQVIAMEQLG